MRDRIKAKADDAIREDAADIRVTCRDGRSLHLIVEHAIGSMERPLSDADLHGKFHALVDPVLGARVPDNSSSSVPVSPALGDLHGLIALTRP